MTILIPAYEPTEKMLLLIMELKEKAFYKILIIDDGSGKLYEEVFNKAENLGCKVLHHENNMGKGTALKTGFQYLLKNGEMSGVVCADSDGQHHTNDIVKIAEAVEVCESEIVLGIRFFDGKIPIKSRLGNKFSAFIFKAATNITLNDTQTGLRGYPSTLFPWLCSINGNRFEYELNLLLSAKKTGINLIQIPITTIYDNNNNGTHFKPFRDSIIILIPFLKFCGSSVVSAILDYTLLFAFQYFTKNLFISVVFSRIISSVFNYSLNKTLVFNKNTSVLKSALKYFSLVIAIMLLNYGMLFLFTDLLRIHIIIAKPVTEILLFTISYFTQKFFVFKF